MASKQELIEKANRQHAAKLAEIEVESAIRELVEVEGFVSPMIHQGRHMKALGRAGTVAYGHCRYESIRKGKNPDRAFLLERLGALPPLPAFKVEMNGTKTFTPDVEAYPGANRVKEQSAVDGVLLRVEPGQHSQSVKVEWFTRLEGEIWEVTVEFPLHSEIFRPIFRPDIRADRYDRGDGPIRKYTECELRELPAGFARIRWASGGPDIANSFTVFAYSWGAMAAALAAEEVKS